MYIAIKSSKLKCRAGRSVKHGLQNEVCCMMCSMERQAWDAGTQASMMCRQAGCAELIKHAEQAASSELLTCRAGSKLVVTDERLCSMQGQA